MRLSHSCARTQDFRKIALIEGERGANRQSRETRPRGDKMSKKDLDPTTLVTIFYDSGIAEGFYKKET